MKVAIHARTNIPWQMYYLDKLQAGFRAHGITASHTNSNVKEADLDVILGPHWPMALEQGEFLQVNRAFMGISEWSPGSNHCVAIGWNGMNGRADFCIPKSLDKNRYKKFINIDTVWDYHKEGGVVICGQADAGRAPIDLNAWHHVMREVIPHAEFRPHPTKGHNEHDWKLSQLAITLNSTVAVDALLHGNAVVSMDEGNPLWAWTPHCGTELAYPDQEHIIQVLSHCQFHCTEVANGTFWEQLSGERSGPLSRFENR